MANLMSQSMNSWGIDAIKVHLVATTKQATSTADSLSTSFKTSCKTKEA